MKELKNPTTKQTLEAFTTGLMTNAYLNFCNSSDMQNAIQALEKQTPIFVTCPKGWQGVRDTRYYCPTCGKPTRRYEPYCHNCGQAVKYPKEKVVDNRIELDWSER